MRHREPSYNKFQEQVGMHRVHNLVNDYTNATTRVVADRDEHIFSELVKQGSDEALFNAGALALDVASKSSIDDAERIYWLQRANQSWSRISAKVSKTGNLTHGAVNSAIHHATLPAYQVMLLSETLPDFKVRNRMYDNLCQIGECAIGKFSELTTQERTRLNIERQMRLAGTIGELSILLMLQRFARNKLNNREQLTLPSRLSEDNGINRRAGSPIAKAWDINIFQQFDTDDIIDNPFKIQVKTRKPRHQKHYSYNDEITLVHIREDLFVADKENHDKLSPLTIIRELIHDYRGSATKTLLRRLDNRTEKLLDILG
ncbi:MAG: hypothetical protein U0451_01130 [Candidatus Saccharimonadales bacterium]